MKRRDILIGSAVVATTAALGVIPAAAESIDDLRKVLGESLIQRVDYIGLPDSPEAIVQFLDGRRIITRNAEAVCLINQAILKQMTTPPGLA